MENELCYTLQTKGMDNIMPLLLFLFWIIINGKITLEIVIFGIIISAGVSLFVYKVMHYKSNFDVRLLKRSYLWVAYGVLLIIEIFKANFQVIKLILTPKVKLEPAIVTFHTDLITETCRVSLANSITLTPGTITAAMVDDELQIHCIDKSFADGIKDSSFVKMLRKIEKVR